MKKSLIAITLLLFISACGGSKKDEIGLKKNEFTVELGEKISLNPTVYLNTTQKDVIDSAKVSIDGIKEEVKKEYVPVGAYYGKITYKVGSSEKEDSFVVRVKDTKKPKFEDFTDTIRLKVGVVGEDLRKYYFAKDLSDVTIRVDTSKVDFNTVGKYEITVTATDASKNKSEKKATVIIFEENKEEEKTITKETIKPDYACPNALYDKMKPCEYIPEDKLLRSPNINFYTEAERDAYVSDNGLEGAWLGYYQVTNNGKEKINIWYVNGDKSTDTDK